MCVTQNSKGTKEYTEKVSLPLTPVPSFPVPFSGGNFC